MVFKNKYNRFLCAITTESDFGFVPCLYERANRGIGQPLAVRPLRFSLCGKFTREGFLQEGLFEFGQGGEFLLIDCL
jgi:hypothetical protein